MRLWRVSGSRSRGSLSAQAPDTAGHMRAFAVHPWAGAKRILNPVVRGSDKVSGSILSFPHSHQGQSHLSYLASAGTVASLTVGGK